MSTITDIKIFNACLQLPKSVGEASGSRGLEGSESVRITGKEGMGKDEIQSIGGGPGLRQEGRSPSVGFNGWGEDRSVCSRWVSQCGGRHLRELPYCGR